MQRRLHATDALIAEFDEFYPLRGFSGATIFLVRSPSGTLFVRKGAGDPSENTRLRAQRDKLTELTSILANIAHVPEILGEGERDGRYYFDLEYVSGEDAVTFVGAASYPELETFADQVAALLRAFSESQRNTLYTSDSLAAALTQKANQIRLDCSPEAWQLVDALVCRLQTLSFSGDLHATAYHGDLTLENILVDREGRIWLIDPIPAPVEHFWMDIAKLHQDLEARWFQRRGAAIAEATRLYLASRVRKFCLEVDPRYADLHYPLLSLTLARVLPYAKTADDSAFVIERLRHLSAKLHEPLSP